MWIGFSTRFDGERRGAGIEAANRDTDPPRAVRRGACLSIGSAALLALAVLPCSGAADAQPLEALIERLDRLERENRQLRKEIDELEAARSAATKPAELPRESKRSGYVRLNPRYGHAVLDPAPFDLSFEFSRFVAGPDGAPRERQDHFVVGAAWFVRPSVRLFAEYLRVRGFAPLNFLSGGSVRDVDGNVIPDRAISDATARSSVFLVGVNAAF